MNDLVKRGALGGDVESLRQALLVEGARKRDWTLIDQALVLAPTIDNRADRFKTFILSAISEHAEGWYDEDVKDVAQYVADEVERGEYEDMEAFEEGLRNWVDGWLGEDGWRCLLALKHTRGMTQTLRRQMTTDVEDVLCMGHGLENIPQALVLVQRRIQGEETFEEGERYIVHMTTNEHYEGEVVEVGEHGLALRGGVGYHADTLVHVDYAYIVGADHLED